MKLDDDPLFSEWSSATPGGVAVTPNAIPSVAPYELGFEDDEVPFVTVPAERRERLQRYVMWTVGGCVAVCLAAAVRVGVTRDTLSETDAAAIGVAVAAAHEGASVTTASLPESVPHAANEEIPLPVAVDPSETAEDETAETTPAEKPAAERAVSTTSAPATVASTSVPTAVAATTPLAPAPVPQLAPSARVTPSPARAADDKAPPAKTTVASASPPAAGTPAPTKTAVQEREDARRALEKGKYRDAASAAERAATLDPSDAEAWLILGAARQELGQAALAHAAFKSCVQTAKHGPIGECRAMLH